MRKNGLTLIVVFAFCAAIFLPGLLIAGVFPKYSEFTLSNGLQVVLVEDNRQPLVDFRMSFGTGSSTDLARLSGRAAIACDMFKEGTKNYTSDTLLSAIDATGGVIHQGVRRDNIFIQGNFLSRDLDFSMNILAEMVIRSQLPEEGLERLKKRLLSRTVRGQSIAIDRLINTLYNSVYGDEGYGLPVMGTQVGLRKICIDDIRKFFSQNIRPNNTLLVVAGNFKINDTRKLIKKLFSNWEKGNEFSKPIVNKSIPDSLRIILYDNREACGTDFMLGRSAASRKSEHTPSLLLLNYILGQGGEVSRLSKRLIHEQKLVTDIRSKVDWSREEGMFFISGATTNEMAVEAIRQTLEVMNDLRNIRISAAELEEAKNFFRGIISGYFENAYGTVNRISYILNWELTLDHYDNILKEFDSITPNHLRKTAQMFLDENHMTVVISGPGDILKRGLSDIAPIEVIDSDQD
jgi:zinc protease